MNKIKKFLVKFKKPKFFIPAIVIVVILLLIIFGGKKKPINFVEAKLGNISQEVSVTGRVKSAESVELAFEKSGRVSGIFVDVGDLVYQGKILAQLEIAELLAQLNQTLANLKTQQAKLDELKAGSRPEEIEIKELEVEKTQQDLINDYNDAFTYLNDAYAKANDAIRNQSDDIFSNDEESNPQLTFLTTDSQVEYAVEEARSSMTNLLNSWNAEIGKLTVDDLDGIDESLQKAQNYLIEVRAFLNKTIEAVNKSVSLGSAVASGYKTDLNSGLTEVNTAINNISSSTQTINSQNLTIEKTKKELDLLLAGATAEQITAQEAQVDQAQASVDSANAQLNKAYLKAPFSGTVTQKSIKLGEIVSAAQPAISVMLTTGFEIEANIPEADISKVSIGDPVRITLDAYGDNEIFEAKVLKIDPAETMIDGVATYKVTIQFVKSDERIMSGLTANIDIITETKENVLIIPNRAISSKNGVKTVKILSGEDITSKEIKTGLKGSDGNIEIVEGLQIGDKIVYGN